MDLKERSVCSGVRAMKVSLLDAGADDYVTEPFSTAGLQARVRARLRRTRGAPLPAGAGALDLDGLRDARALPGAVEAVFGTEGLLPALAGAARRIGRPGSAPAVAEVVRAEYLWEAEAA